MPHHWRWPLAERPKRDRPRRRVADQAGAEDRRENQAAGFPLTAQRELERPRALNAALGQRREDELAKHSGAKGKVPSEREESAPLLGEHETEQTAFPPRPRGMRPKFFLPLLAAGLAILPAAAAPRTFTSADGSQTFRGEVIGLGEDEVTVRRDDGRVFTFNPEILSGEDRIWLGALAALDNNPFDAPRRGEGAEPVDETESRRVGEAGESRRDIAEAARRAEEEARLRPGDPVGDLSPTARALLTGSASASTADLPARRSRSSGVQIYYDTPVYSSWVYSSGWCPPVRHHHGHGGAHVHRHGDHVHLHFGGQGSHGSGAVHSPAGGSRAPVRRHQSGVEY